MKRVKVISWIGGLLGLALVAGFFLYVRPLLQFAPIASAYGAKKVCSCVFVAGRSLEACRSDFTEDVSAVEFVRDGNTIRAKILDGRYDERAVFTPGLGCALVPEGGAPSKPDGA